MRIPFRKCFEVIGYTYEADCHCLQCTKNRFGGDPTEVDYERIDNEGNSIHPIFLDSEWDFPPVCEECLKLLNWDGITLEVK